jgi:hypothetical protein
MPPGPPYRSKPRRLPLILIWLANCHMAAGDDHTQQCVVGRMCDCVEHEGRMSAGCW